MIEHGRLGLACAGAARWQRGNGVWWRFTGLAAVMFLACQIVPVHAQSDMSWVRFPGQPSGNVDSHGIDRDFVREWESRPPAGFPTLSRANLSAIDSAIKLYERVVKDGGFPQIPSERLSMGSWSDAVPLLRKRLTLSGDFADDGYQSQNFDYALEKAVRRFQASNGLSPTGVVDPRTIAALNVPASVRLQQLKINQQRLRGLLANLPKKYVLVNIPAAQVEAVEDSRVVTRHAGVVGKLDRQTPELRSQIHELNFNPVWHLPPTTIRKDLAPKGVEMSRRGQDVLERYKIEAFDSAGRRVKGTQINWSGGGAFAYTFRQQPGPETPLVFVKTNFHNSHAVYLHDTPSHTLFGRNFRAATSGCVRVAGIEKLAEWLMADHGWTKERILGIKESGERLDVKLRRPVPLIMAYITAWATEDGGIQFRRDLYNRDRVGQVASTY